MMAAREKETGVSMDRGSAVMRVTTTKKYDVNGNGKITVRWRTVDGTRQGTVNSDQTVNDDHAHAAALRVVLPAGYTAVEVPPVGGSRRKWDVSYPSDGGL